MQPHARELAILFPQDVLHRAEALVQLIEMRLDLCVVRPLGHHIHVVERKIAELGAYEVIFTRLPRHNVSQLQPVPNAGGAVQTDPEERQKEENHHHLIGNTHKKIDMSQALATSEAAAV